MLQQEYSMMDAIPSIENVVAQKNSLIQVYAQNIA
jgi:hypothetical protein